MNLDDYITSIKEAGWLEHIMPEDAPDADQETIEDAVMRTELSLCFPLFTDSQKLVLLGAWWAQRALTLGVNLPREKLSEGVVPSIENSTTAAERVYMQAKESIESLRKIVAMTPAQVEFIETVILHVPFL